MRRCAAGPRWTARCRVLSRARISFDTNAPCVLASHSPSAPRRRGPIPERTPDTELTQTPASGSGTVERGDRLRLFCGLRLPDDVVERLAAWQEQELRGRIVPRSNLHITLAFLGSRPAGELESIGAELRAAADRAKRPTLTVRGYRETRSVAMLTLEDEGWRAASLAKDLFRRLERLGVYRRESRQWLPHVTVARFQERPRLRPPLPELGPFSPSDAAVYLSRLRPSGAQYEVLDSFALGG